MNSPSELHATPYDTNSEEFEIQFIDGDLYQLFAACQINQCNIELWLGSIECLSGNAQIELYYRCSILGDTPSTALDKLQTSGSIHSQSLVEYTNDLLEETGVLASIPDHLQPFFDCNEYARHLEISGVIDEFSYREKTYTVAYFTD